MTRVVVQPAGQAEATIHYADTILTPVPVARLAAFLSPDDLDGLGHLHSSDGIPTWGVTPGKSGVNRRKWEKLERGDRAFFSRSGGIFSTGVVTWKTHNPGLAEALWKRNADGETWEYVYFVDELESLHISYEDFNRIVGYKPNAVIQGFNVLDTEKSERLLDEFRLWSASHSPPTTAEEYQEAVSTFDPSKPLDAKANANRRREQSFLRKRLVGDKQERPCGICGQVLPVTLLTAAHVKKRSVCSPEEMLDFDHVAMLLCALGCDRLYEDGFLTVREGVVVIGDKASTDALEARLKSLEGLRCNHWSGESEAYFSWHRRFHDFE